MHGGAGVCGCGGVGCGGVGVNLTFVSYLVITLPRVRQKKN